MAYLKLFTGLRVFCFIAVLFLFLSDAFALPKFNKTNNPTASTVLKADEISGDKITNVLTATGNVEVNKGVSTAYSNKAIYDKNTKTIFLEGDVKVKDIEIGNVRATKAEVKDDFSSGKFFNSKMVFIDGSYLTSPEIDRQTPQITTLKKPIFSICPDEDISKNNDLAGKKWDMASIKSSKATIDRENENIKIKNGILRFYNIPFFYSPYLKINLPSKKRESGFLQPSYFRSTNLGTGILLPYYFNIAPNMDLTITPFVAFSGSNQMLVNNQLRHMATYGEYTLNLELANNKISSSNDKVIINRSKQNIRGNLFGEGKFDFNTDYGADFNVNLLSDRNYLRDYHNGYLNYTMSKVNLDYIHKRDYSSIKVLKFQELININQEKQTPTVLPVIDSRIESDKSFFSKEKYALTSNFTSITRSSGLQYRRLSFVPEVTVPFNVNGNLFAFSQKIQTDFYSLDNNYNYNEPHNNFNSFLTNYKPETSLSWRLPLMKKSKNSMFVIEPMANFVMSSYRKNFVFLPNEDSNNSELSINNLFINDRLAGYDRNESGQRFNYGVRTSFFNKYGGEFGLSIGQSYRRNNKQQDVIIQGFNQNQKSNIVGQALYKSAKYFSILYSYQLNESSYRNDVNEVVTSLNLDRATISANYIFLRRTTQNLNEIKQLNLNTSVKVTQTWKADFFMINDLVNQRMIGRGLTLHREGCCTIFEFSIRQYNPSSLAKPQSSLNFSLSFKNL